jgi:hypothetical protein
MNEIISLLDSTCLEHKPDSDYMYNGIVVPRVTKILQKCIHSDSLMYWANSLGFRHQSYKKTLNAAANIGTCCHNNIDQFIENPAHVMDIDNPTESINAYNSFLKWFTDVCSVAKVDVMFHEKQLVCKYFGGTLDGLYNINGKIYLIDYKTSNHITYKYLLQVAAYRYMLRNELGIEIDGCIILQLSKSDVSYNEYVLNFDNINHLSFINECETAFLSLVFAYYNICNIETKYSSLDWEVV